MSKHALLALGVCALLVAAPLAATVPADLAANLGQDLTPVGAEKAGNAEGTIPAWTPATRRGTLLGEYSGDPAIDADKPLFTISPSNRSKYESHLTEGHRTLLKTFATYRMNVYPSHRVVTWPQEMLKATIANALTAQLKGSDMLAGARQGFPFPIPQSGAEPIWNHKLKWRGDEVTRYNNQMIVQKDGSFQLTKIIEDARFSYASRSHPQALGAKGGEFLQYIAHTIAPPRLADTFILVHDRAGTGAAGRAAWIYKPGLRHIRRAPSIGYDNPAEGTDGQQFYDQVDMFNGGLDRYDWKLLGKKEFYIPYDSNRISGPGAKYADLAHPDHLNPELARYELHRVWVVEATLKADARHAFARRTFYLDEDGWNIVAVDDYDNDGKLVQFQEGHLVFSYNILASTTTPEVIYHLDTGRYFVTAMANEDKPNRFDVRFASDFFNADSVQKRTTN